MHNAKRINHAIDANRDFPAHFTTPFIEDGLDNDRLGGEMPLVVTKYKIDVFVFRRGRPEWLETTQDCSNGGYDLMGLTKQ
ncbi:hypothetical protein ABFV48_26550, partial [Pseudomonas syringae]